MAVFNVKPTDEKGGSGGVILVDKLPAVGKEECLYKTPDGKIWSCTYKEVQELEVGKSYKLKESVSGEDLYNLVEGRDGFHFYIVDGAYKVGEWEGVSFSAHFPENDGDPKYTCTFALCTASGEEPVFDNTASYSVVVNGSPLQPATISLEGFSSYKDVPQVSITQNFIDEVLDAWMSLENFAFLFIIEPETKCIWSQVGASSTGGSSYACTYYDYLDSVIGKHFDVDAIIALLEKHNIDIDYTLSPENQTVMYIGYNPSGGTFWSAIRFGYNVCVGGPDIYLFSSQLQDLVSDITFRGILTKNKEKIEAVEISSDIIWSGPSEEVFINSITDNSGLAEYISFEEAFSIFK